MSNLPESELSRKYDPENLYSMLNTSRWQGLSPNYQSPRAMLPKELSTEDVEEIVDVVISEEALRSTENRHIQFTFRREIPNLGSIEAFGRGESNVVYLLTNMAGRNMVVKFGDYGVGLKVGLQIPQDRRIYQSREGIGKNLWYYSDLKTYLCLPITPDSYGVIFQEYGGRNNSTGILNAFAARRARQYIKSSERQMILSVREGELKHPRHFLYNRGIFRIPAVIDIPVEQLKR